jgi:hypothetical protein
VVAVTAMTDESFEAKFASISTGLVRGKERNPQASFEACYVFFNP